MAFQPRGRLGFRGGHFLDRRPVGSKRAWRHWSGSGPSPRGERRREFPPTRRRSFPGQRHLRRGKVFAAALADRITAASQKVGKARRGGVAVSSGESALRVEGTAASISEVRALVPISVGIRSDPKPTRREALGGGLLLHPLRGPRRSRHNLARDCGPCLLNHAAMSSRPIAEDGPRARGNKMHRPYLQNSAVP